MQSPEALRAGRILSSQCTWSSAAAIEERFAPPVWDPGYGGIGGFHVRVVGQSGDVASDILAPLAKPGASVDQRVKVSGWLETFQARGGHLVIGQVDEESLTTISEGFDLVIVCAGKFRGKLGDVFPVDPQASRYDTVQRTGAVVFLHGRDQPLAAEGRSAFEEWTVVPGVGDFFAIPALSESGPCHVVCMECFLGGPGDQFDGVREPEVILQRIRSVFERWLPWERGRWDNARLTDAGAAICGGFRPVTRKPVATLANGKRVLAFGDAHVLMDPLTAQGANTHLKNLPGFLAAIEAANGVFDEAWMHATAQANLQRPLMVEAVQEEYLNPRRHLWSVFDAASSDPDFGSWWVDAHFERPEALLPWIASPERTRAFLARREPVAASA